MPYSRLLRLGSTTFPVGTSVASIERGRTIGTAKLARSDGMRQTLGYRNGIRVTLRIPIIKGPLNTNALRAREDTVRAMLAVGPASLYLYDDRYYRCVESEREPVSMPPTGFDRIHEMEAYLIGPDALLMDSTLNSETLTSPASGATLTFTVGGNAPAQPKISITVGGSLSQTIAFTVANNSTGEEFTLTGDVTGGDVIVVSSLLKYCKIGTTDYMTLFNGLFPKLWVGSNELQFTYTSSTISAVTVEWNNRYE